MFDFYNWLAEANEPRQRHFDFMKMPKVSLDEAREKGMFGPVYHGTSEQGREGISDAGFNIFIGLPRRGAISNGYELSNYDNGIPAPIHHLGFGVYFTTSKTNAKMFNQGTTSGLKEYYLDVPRLEKINFGVHGTMMKWWKSNGYDMPPITNDQVKLEVEQQWLKSTINLTNSLKSKYDAVWFKGKSMRKLLDGDQICVYDVNHIYELDRSLDPGKEMGNGILAKSGDRFLIKGTTSATAIIKGMRPILKIINDMWSRLIGDSHYFLDVGQWKDPGNQFEQVYRPLLTQQIESMTREEWFKDRMNNSNLTVQQNIESIVNYYLKNRMNFPSALIGKVLKKRERLK